VKKIFGLLCVLVCLCAVTSAYAQNIRTGKTPEAGSPISQFVRRILQDTKGNMWFGTNGDGVSFTNYTKVDGLVDSDVWSLVIDSKGTIWIGTLQGVSRFDGETFTHVTSEDGVNGIECWSLYLDSSGDVWFPVEGFGVYRFDGESFSNFSEQAGLASNAIQCIYEDSEGRLWCGGWKGLFRFEGESFVGVTAEGPWPQ